VKVFISVLAALLVAAIAFVALLAFGVHAVNRPGHQAAYQLAYLKGRVTGKAENLAAWDAAKVAERSIEQNEDKTNATATRRWNASSRLLVAADTSSQRAAPNAQLALRAFASEFGRHFTHCGDFYVSLVMRTVNENPPPAPLTATPDLIVEIKNVHFEFVGSMPLTEAQRANGLEWHGNVQYTFSIGRVFDLSDARAGSHMWAPWQDRFFVGSTPTYVARQGGVWDVQLQLGDGINQVDYRRMPCADVPPG
jgi:hypothetical protein